MFKSSAFLKVTQDINTSSQNRLLLHQLREQLLNRLSRMKDNITQHNRDKIQGHYSVSLIQQQRLNKFDELLVDRNVINMQEKQLQIELEQLLKQAEDIHRDELRKGYRNSEADMSLTQQIKDLTLRMKEIERKSDHLHTNFTTLKNVDASSSINLSHNTTSSSLYSDQLLLASKLKRDQDRLYSLRKHSQHDEVIPRDKLEEYNNQFTNHAQYLYQGTKFQANDEQKLTVLSNLRKQIERHIQHRGLEGAIIDLPFIKGEEIQNAPQTLMEYDQTIWDILQLKNDYIKAGGSDPNMLLQLNNLEAYYKQNHPARRQSLHNEVSTTNMMDRSILTEHPIFNYLPKTFQKQIYQLETENNIAKQNNMNNPLLNESLRIGGQIESTLRTDESKVQYLKQAEMDLITSMIYNDDDKETKLKKLREIADLKAVAEKNLFESRIQQSLAEREESLTLLNKKPSKVQKENYLSFLRGNLSSLPLKYEPEEGLVVRVDFVSHLPIVYTYISILLGIGFEITQETDKHPVVQEHLHLGRSMILERFEYYDQLADPETILFMKVQAFSEEVGGSLIPLDLGWTILKLFDDEGNLLSGRYILPLYDNKNTTTIELKSIPEIPSLKLGVRITLPKEPLMDTDTRIIEESEYRVPDLHIKNVTFIQGQPQVPIIKLKPRSFPVELQGLKLNDPRLKNSQLPPNIYTTKFTILDEQELSRRKELEEYEKSRASRPRLRAGGGALTTEKSDTPAARPRLQKKSPAPPERLITKTDTLKFETPRTPAPQPIIEQAPSQQQFYQIEQPLIFDPLAAKAENRMVFSLYRIDIIDPTLHPKMKLRMAIFVQDKIADGLNKKPLLINMNLIPSTTEADSFSFSLEHIFDFTLQDLFKIYNKDDLLDCYLFLGFFDDTKLFGWLALQIFEVKSSGLVIQSGYFTDNLILPPGQQPPFDESKMKRSEMRIHYMIKQDDESDTKLQEFDYYEQVEKPKKKPTIVRKKIPIVENQRWVTQLRIDMTKLIKFHTKLNISYRLALLHKGEVIIDTIKRPCLRQENVDAFQSQVKNELNINQTVVFRVGLQYLLDVYHETTDEVVLFFTFFIRNTLVGIVQFPIYQQKLNRLIAGVQRVPLYQLDKTGKQGKQTDQQVEFSIREDPLRLDDIEETPKYLKPKQKLNIEAQDVQKRLLIHIIQLNGYDKAITYTIKLLNDGLVYQEENGGDLCIIESNSSFIPDKKSIQIDTQSAFNIPVNSLVQNQIDEIKRFQILLEFQEERSKAVIGWMLVPLIENYQFNSEPKQVNLYQGKPPSQIDTLGVKPSNFTLKMQLLYEVPRIQEEKNEVNRYTLVLLNIKGIDIDAYCYLKIGIMVDSIFLKDEGDTALAFTTNKVYNQDKVMDMDYETFYMRLSKEPMLNKEKDRTLLVIYVLGHENAQIAWVIKPFFKDGEVDIGKFTLQCYDKPFQRPPIKQKPKKNDVTIQFELKR